MLHLSQLICSHSILLEAGKSKVDANREREREMQLTLLGTFSSGSLCKQWTLTKYLVLVCALRMLITQWHAAKVGRLCVSVAVCLRVKFEGEFGGNWRENLFLRMQLFVRLCLQVELMTLAGKRKGNSLVYLLLDRARERMNTSHRPPCDCSIMRRVKSGPVNVARWLTGGIGHLRGQLKPVEPYATLDPSCKLQFTGRRGLCQK